MRRPTGVPLTPEPDGALTGHGAVDLHLTDIDARMARGLARWRYPLTRWWRRGPDGRRQRVAVSRGAAGVGGLRLEVDHG